MWKAALEAQQQKRRERQQQAGGQRQGGAAAAAAASVQQQREDQKLLLQSPQAKAGLGLAVGGRRVSALGTSGGECVAGAAGLGALSGSAALRRGLLDFHACWNTAAQHVAL